MKMTSEVTTLRRYTKLFIIIIIIIIIIRHSLPLLNRTKTKRSYLLTFLTPVMVVINYLTKMSVKYLLN